MPVFLRRFRRTPRDEDLLTKSGLPPIFPVLYGIPSNYIMSESRCTRVVLVTSEGRIELDFLSIMYAPFSEIPSLQVGPLSATHDLGFLENPAPRGVGLVAAVHRVGFIPVSWSSWIVIAAHRRKMYLWGGMDIDSPSLQGQWPFSPLFGRCKARNWNTFRTRSFPSFASGPVPRCGQYWVRIRAAKLTLVHSL